MKTLTGKFNPLDAFDQLYHFGVADEATAVRNLATRNSERTSIMTNDADIELRKWALDMAMRHPPRDYGTAFQAAKLFYKWVKTMEDAAADPSETKK